VANYIFADSPHHREIEENRWGVATVWLISAYPHGQFPATRYPTSFASDIDAICLEMRTPTELEAICQGLDSLWRVPFQGFVEAA